MGVSPGGRPKLQQIRDIFARWTEQAILPVEMSVGAPQQILSGKYRLERELGRGGMGSVWLAEHLTLRSPVAIKLIDPGIAENPEALARFLREAQAAASLRSPHVVQILDHGVDNGVPFIVMELLEGESLASRLERVHRLSPAETARILTQVARAVTRAHEAGIVHRDLKPDNIFLVRNDEEEVAKVLDFGVAKASSHGMGAATGATRTGSVLGTPYYMSPEQAEGAKSIDGRSDLWALGVIAWECLLGARPFEAETLGGLLLAICARDIPSPSSVGTVPPGFDAWFARACSRNVAYRFSSAKELAAELRQVCSGTGSELAGGYGPPQAPTSSQHGPSVQASSLPLASTTGHLSMSASRQPLSKKSMVPLLIGGGVVLSALAVAALFALRPGSSDTIASAAPVVAAPPSSPKAEPTVAPAALPEPAKPEAAALASAAPTPSSAPSLAAPAAAATAAARPPARAIKPAARDKPATPAPAAAPAAQPQPQPTTKPRVNLGI
jgi:serine/threonine-protein kinase